MPFNPDIISRERNNRGWSTARLAAAMSRLGRNITDTTVRNYEAGKSVPNANTLEGFSILFALSPEIFFTQSTQHSAGNTEKILSGLPLEKKAGDSDAGIVSD